MEERDFHERRKIFKEELKALKDEKYIEEIDYNRMNYAYQLYVQQLDKKIQKKSSEDSVQTEDSTEASHMVKNGEKLEHQREMDPMKELIQKLKANQQQEIEAAARKKETAFTLQKSIHQGQGTDERTQTRPAPDFSEASASLQTNTKPFTKPVKNTEQTRERNIIWGLILGVILLFIGGLVFGTSNWSSMNNLVKVIMVSLVSIVFFVISFIAGKYFKINKTAFAFLTLGSLFLPISIISIAFFALLGPFFSLYGEGRYVFGLIGSLVCLSLYTYIAAKYKHRLFVWFTYLTATIAASFLLAMTYLPSDFFYFGMMLYNALLLFGYYKLKNQEKWAVFTKELPLYAQLNLIVSTLLMLFFFENEIFYSFNILLTAVLYISMVYINKSKHYHIIFTLLFVYGMYQLIDHSILRYYDYMGFALIGMLYLAFQKYAGEEHQLAKIFRLTSGIISFCAFIFISIQGLLLRSDEDSFVLLAAYLIIAVNYLILANMTRISLFRYLTPIFLMVSALQSYYVLLPGLDGKWLELYLFVFAAAMFAVLYIYNHFHYFTVIRKSSFIVSIITMIFTIIFSFVNGELTYTALLLFAFGIIALITYTHPANDNIQMAAAWANPVSWGLAIIAFFDYLNSNVPFYKNHVEIIGHLALGGLLLLGVSYFWKKRNRADFDVHTFLTGAGLYTLSILSTPLEGYEHPYLASTIYFVGVGVYILLVYKMRQNVLWLFVSITTLVFFLSLSNIFGYQVDLQWTMLYYLSIPLFMLAIYEWIGRKIHALKPYFFWTAHVYLAPAFLFSIFTMLYGGLHPAILFTALAAYLFSTLRQTKEWEIKLFLYAAFTTIPFILYLHFRYYGIEELLTFDYLFFIVSGIITIVWKLVNEEWKRRIDLYLIPQSVIGLILFIAIYTEVSIIHLGLFTIYTLLTLFLLHKRNWRNYTLLPLFLTIVYIMQYMLLVEKTMGIALVVVVFFAHQLYGKFTYNELIKYENKLEIDWYTISAAAYIVMLFVLIPVWEPLWMRLIPALLVVYYLFMLINRFAGVVAKRMVKTAAAISLLLPYYTILWELDLNQYIATELIVLPFIVLTIFLSRRTWQDYKKAMNRVQTVVLLLVTAILVMDALESNTIYDAIIIGVLSLISIICGMQYRIKSYFFVGIGVLLLNVLLQTRPLWGNFPWWGYLVVAGLTLISIAGFNELQKQKDGTDNKSFLQKKKEQFRNKFKNWN